MFCAALNTLTAVSDIPDARLSAALTRLLLSECVVATGLLLDVVAGWAGTPGVANSLLLGKETEAVLGVDVDVDDDDVVGPLTST